jgi:hypothetical protein
MAAARERPRAVTAEKRIAEVVREVLREVLKVVLASVVEAVSVVPGRVTEVVVEVEAAARTAGTKQLCQQDGPAAERFAVESNQFLPW